MTRKSKFKKTSIVEINMVPFIDVMLVLLIIFMATAPLLSPSVIDLPSIGSSAKQLPSKVLQIIIKDENNLSIKTSQVEQQVSMNDLITGVQQLVTAGDGSEDEQAAIVISADKSVNYGTVIQVMDILKQEKFNRVGLSVKASN